MMKRKKTNIPVNLETPPDHVEESFNLEFRLTCLFLPFEGVFEFIWVGTSNYHVKKEHPRDCAIFI